MEIIHTIGRRKTSVARLYISKGKGNIMVNKKAYNKFFPTATLQYKIIQMQHFGMRKLQNRELQKLSIILRSCQNMDQVLPKTLSKQINGI